MARVTLTQPGEDVDVGGDLTIVGTRSGGEVITVLRGTILLDASFNAGGDTVRLPDDAAFFTARQLGSSVIIAGLGVSVTIPVGTTGLTVNFNDVSRTLLYDLAAGAIKLGDQFVTATPGRVTPAGGFPTLTGTEGADVLSGTGGDDVIDGLGGADRINGGAGNDVLRGGAGGDDLDGSFGNDQLYGGPGDDYLQDHEGASAYLDGGGGNDWLALDNPLATSVQLIGGDGDDYIEVNVGGTGTGTVDAGAGLDRVVLDTDGMAIGVTLGSGRDQLVLADAALASARFGAVTVVDFQAGPFGDTVEFLRALSSSAIGWSQSTNPFSSGHLRLIDRDGSAVLQFDRDGAGATVHNVRDLIVFSGVAAGALTRENLEGFDPMPATSLQDGSGVYHQLAAISWDHHGFA